MDKWIKAVSGRLGIALVTVSLVCSMVPGLAFAEEDTDADPAVMAAVTTADAADVTDAVTTDPTLEETDASDGAVLEDTAPEITLTVVQADTVSNIVSADDANVADGTEATGDAGLSTAADAGTPAADSPLVGDIIVDGDTNAIADVNVGDTVKIVSELDISVIRQQINQVFQQYRPALSWVFPGMTDEQIMERIALSGPVDSTFTATYTLTDGLSYAGSPVLSDSIYEIVGEPQDTGSTRVVVMRLTDPEQYTNFLLLYNAVANHSNLSISFDVLVNEAGTQQVVGNLVGTFTGTASLFGTTRDFNYNWAAAQNAGGVDEGGSPDAITGTMNAVQPEVVIPQPGPEPAPSSAPVPVAKPGITPQPAQATATIAGMPATADTADQLGFIVLAAVGLAVLGAGIALNSRRRSVK